MTIKGTSKYEVTGNLDIEGSDLTVKGANTVVEGTAQAELKSSGGSIKVIGQMIYLN